MHRQHPNLDYAHDANLQHRKAQPSKRVVAAGLLHTLARSIKKPNGPGSMRRALSQQFPQTATHRAMFGIAWNVLGSVVAQGGTFLSSVVLARVLGKQIFGQFAMVQSTVIALTNLASLGLGITATKYVSQFRSTQPDRAGRILGISSLVALLAGLCFAVSLIVFAPKLATDAALIPDLRLSAIYVFFITLNGYQLGALMGLEAFGRMARISLVSGPVAVVGTWVLAYRFGLEGGVLALGLNAFLVWWLSQIGVKQECCRAGIRVRYRDAWQERSALIRFSIPAVVTGLTGSAAIWWCNKLLVKNAGYAELAVFVAVSNLRLMVVFLPGVVGRVVSPLLNNLLANGEIKTYQRTFWYVVAGNGALGLCLAGILSLAGTYLLHLFGKDFAGSSALLLLLLSSAVIEIVASNLYQAIFTAASLWWQAGIGSIWAILLIVLSVLVLSRYGAAGLAFSYLAAWCVAAVLYGVLAIALLGKRPIAEA
jgi:O-antigen/teichoic acid export membrane protein